jgi:hypothetical protein
VVMPQDTRVQLLTGSRHENHPTSDGTDARSTIAIFMAGDRPKARGNCWRNGYPEAPGAISFVNAEWRLSAFGVSASHSLARR